MYGRSTGVGALITARVMDTDQPWAAASAGDAGISKAEAAPEHGDGLLRSHATTAGPPLPSEQVRAMTAVRIEQIAVGRSGLGPRAASALVGPAEHRPDADHRPVTARSAPVTSRRWPGSLDAACRRPGSGRRAGADVVERVDHRSCRAGSGRSGSVAGRRDRRHGVDLPGQGRCRWCPASAGAGPFPGPQRVARVLRRLERRKPPGRRGCRTSTGCGGAADPRHRGRRGGRAAQGRHRAGQRRTGEPAGAGRAAGTVPCITAGSTRST